MSRHDDSTPRRLAEGAVRATSAGDLAGAHDLLDDALAALSRGGSATDVVAVLVARSDLAAALGDRESCRTHLDHATRVLMQLPQPPTDLWCRTHEAVARFEAGLGDETAALARLGRVVRRAAGVEPDAHVSALLAVAELHLDADPRRLAAARVTLARARAALAASGGSDLRLADLLRLQARLSLACGRVSGAIRDAEQGVAVRRRELGAEHPDLGRDLAGLARLHARARQTDEARRCARDALVVLVGALGRDHHDVVTVVAELAELSRERQPARSGS